MANEIVNELNWVDVVVFIVIIRIILIGLKEGFVVELFKLLGTLFAVFISLHYYSYIAEFIGAHSPLPVDFAGFFCLASIMVIVLVFFKFFRDGLLVLIKIQPLAVLDKWGSVVLAIIRAALVSSITILIIFLSTISYLQGSAVRSLSSRYLSDLAPRTYVFMFDNIFSKFSPKEEINSAVFKAIEKKE